MALGSCGPDAIGPAKRPRPGHCGSYVDVSKSVSEHERCGLQEEQWELEALVVNRANKVDVVLLGNANGRRDASVSVEMIDGDAISRGYESQLGSTLSASSRRDSRIRS